MTHQKTIGIRTKTKYVMKYTEYRDYTPYWQKRLLDNPPTHFYKHNQHGVRSCVFEILYLGIVNSPKMYLEEGVLHTEKAILIIGTKEKNEEKK